MSSPILQCLERLHQKYAGLCEGEVATYIPELAKADPESFAICVATTDGHVYEVGDSRQPFTIQSISKPFTYGLALEDRGLDQVLAKIGVEPTGEAFNSISLAPETGRPLNPMINAGAIAAASLIAGRSAEDKLARLLRVYSLYAGRSLALDDAVYVSERSTGHRNRAIGHMLRNFDIIDTDPDIALDLYFRQCSVSVDCRDLSLMAATLANGGINPLTAERAVQGELVERILSVMATCGMYDYAGEWVYSVGMPAKSGVSGGVLVVLPGQLGIGVFSPRLDSHGNSVRGLRVCGDLSREFHLHVLRVARPARSVIRARYRLAAVRSKRHRPEAERAVLGEVGERVSIYELQGDLVFAAVEAVVRDVVEDSDSLDVAVLDMKRVLRAVEPSSSLVFALLSELASRDKQLVLVVGAGHSRFVRIVEEQNAAAGGPARMVTFSELDRALEWCENRVIARSGARTPDAVSLADHELCRGLDARALRRLEEVLEVKSFAPGEIIIHQGDSADEIFLLTRGNVSVSVGAGMGPPRRLATLSAGMTFGELAIIDRAPRSADVHADTAVECRVLSAGAFDRLGDTDPHIKIALLENILRSAYQMVARLNQEATTLAS